MMSLFAMLSATVPPSEVIIVRAERLGALSPSQQTLTGTELTQTSGVRLDDVLRLVPGASLFRRTPSGAANATIQGISLRPIAPNGAGRALVSLDNVPQNDPFGGWIYWARYNPLFLEKVDVRRGGAGAGFGPMALTGTLDLSEARGLPAGFNASFGSNKNIAAAGRASLSGEGAVFTAMGAYDVSDGAFGISATQRGAVDVPIKFQSTTLTLVTDILRNNGAWSFRASGFSEDKGAGLIGGQSHANGLDLSIARRFESDGGQSRFLIYAQGRDFSNQTVAVAAGRVSAAPSLDQFATPASALGGSVAYVPSAGRLLPSLSLDWRRAEGETRELFRYIGRDFTRTRLAGGVQNFLGVSASLPSPISVVAGHAAVEGNVRLDYWSNRAGIRRETDRATGNITLLEQIAQRSGTVVTGSVSLAQVRGPAKLSVYRTFRPPTLNELHRPFRVGNDVTEANGALVPETLVGMDLDLAFKRGWAGGTLAASATFYVNALDNPIANVTIGTGPGVLPRVGFLPAGGSLRQRQNVGRIVARGIEGSARWDDGPAAPRYYLAASWTDAKVDGEGLLPQLTGKQPAQAPRWSAIANTVLPLSDAITLGLTVRGESARYEDDLNTRRLAAYGAADVRITWQINPRTQVFLTGENVLDASIPTARASDGVVSVTQGRVLRIRVNIGQ